MITEEFLIFILPMILLIGAALVGTVYALPPNTTDWNWGSAYPDGSYENGYPIIHENNLTTYNPYELTDDDLEEDEEIEDEEEHEEWAKAND